MSDEPGSEIQIENGNYSQIHNRILELLSLRNDLSSRELRCLIFLLRMTYGWQKTEDKLSLSQWAKGTNISKSNISVTLNNLVKRKIIIRTIEGAGRGKISSYKFNKYYGQWLERLSEGITIET